MLKRFSLSDLAPKMSNGLLAKLESQHLQTYCSAWQGFTGAGFVRHFRARSGRTQSFQKNRARLSLNLEIWEQNYCFSNFRYHYACSLFGQWNPELKRIFPEFFVFPFRWTRVTEALGTRLGFSFFSILQCFAFPFSLFLIFLQQWLSVY